MRENGIIFSRQSPIISSSDIERMSYIDLIFMQKNLKIISQIRILTARAFKCSLAREGGRADCRTGNVGSFAPVQIENQPSVTHQ